MSIFLDILVLAVIFLCAFIGYRRGFVLTLLRSIGYFIAFPIAALLSSFLAPLVWNGIVRGMVISSIAEKLPDMSAGGGIEKITAGLPDWYNIKPSELIASLTNSITPTKEEVATAVTDNFISPTAIGIIGIILTIIFVILLFIVVMLLSKKLKIFNKIPLVGTANRVLGAVLGVVVGVVWLCIIALVIHLFISVLPDVFTFVNAEIVNDTIIFGPFYNVSRAISGL
jgi:Colicin V production protein.